MSRKVAHLVKSVACVLNGSTESAVAAYFLKSKGYPVTGVSLLYNYQHPDDTAQLREHAVDVCRHLDIPHADVTFTDDMWKLFHNALQEDYKKGMNPDLDILFTKFILTGSLVDFCTRQMGLASVALPFYARSDYGFNSPLTPRIQGTRLLKAIDLTQDESYLLCQTPGKSLQRCVLPMGELPKEAVDMMAEMTSLDTIAICPTLNPVNRNLIPEELKPQDRKGKLIDLVSGKVIDHHSSFHSYYAGMDCSINEQQFYVVEKNVKSGDVFLVDDPNHPSCLSDTFFTSLANWIHKTPYSFYHEKQMMDCSYKTSKHGPMVPCSITVGALNEYCGNDHIIVSSSRPVKSLVPGRFCAFYSGEECIGSANILKSGPSHYAMNYKKYAQKKGNDTKNGWKGLFS